jgi:hypothetical protein
MPDITMCTNTNCNKRVTCFRYLAVPKPHNQSFAKFNNDDCEYYDRVQITDKVRQSFDADQVNNK